MKPSDRQSYAEYRIIKASETYEVALLLFENQRWASVVNRLYYACFYAVGALWVKMELYPKSHTGVKTQFFLNFIKTGKIPLELGKLYSDLFDWRQKGDYGDFFDFEEKDVEPFLEPCRDLIHLIKVEIGKEI